MQHPRIVKVTEVSGTFGLPIGITFMDRPTFPMPHKVIVSTVLLDGAHNEDPLKICSLETGYETMVFLDGCTFFSLYTAKYNTRREALRGHGATVRGILKQKVPLAVPLGHYYAWEAKPEAA